MGRVIAHDLRAPIRGARNLTQWASESLRDGESAEAAESIELAGRRMARLDDALVRLAEFARWAKTPPAPASVFDLATLVKEIARELGEPGVTVTCDTTDIGDLETDRHALQVVLLELVDNAIQHGGPAPTHVRIESSRTPPQPDWNVPEVLRIVVEDDGPGIATGLEETMFRLLRTSGDVNATEVAGVGLALARLLVERRGGSLTWSPGKPRGARFTIRWPLGSAVR